MTVRIHVDRELCIGAGQCALTAPDAFTQDEDGFSAPLTGAEHGGGGPLIREAARVCPVQAISVTDD